MKQVLSILFFLTAAISGLSLLSLAQGAAGQSPQAAFLPDPRFELCIGNPLCTTQTRLQIVEDMSDGMRGALQRIRQTCAVMNYRDCIGPQMEDMRQWRKMDDHARDMMQAVELQYTGTTLNAMPRPPEETGKRLNLIDPAAGYNPDPYTRPDLEQLDRQKRGWWKDWTPSGDPANPYHKW